MGGPGSGRWGMTVTRLTTEGLPQLDVRVLAREGALRPGVTSTVTWDTGVSVSASVPQDGPECLVVTYAVVDRRGLGQPVTERVPLLTTPGTVGGVRAWFGCPDCAVRCALLYALGGRFRCRHCHHLAYASTRDSGRTAARTRARSVLGSRARS